MIKPTCSLCQKEAQIELTALTPEQTAYCQPCLDSQLRELAFYVDSFQENLSAIQEEKREEQLKAQLFQRSYETVVISNNALKSRIEALDTAYGEVKKQNEELIQELEKAFKRNLKLAREVESKKPVKKEKHAKSNT